MRHGRILAGSKGAKALFCLDGEILQTLELPEGVHNVATFLAMAGNGQEVLFEGVKIVGARPKLHVMDFGRLAFESAANPHFRVSASARMARNLEDKLKRFEALETSVKRGVEAMKRAKRAVPQIENQTVEPSGADAGQAPTT